MIEITGDLLKVFREKEELRYIAHQVNTKGVMGAGIAKQIKATYPEAFAKYSRYCNDANGKGKSLLGDFIFTSCEDGTIINFFGQGGYGGIRETNYVALATSIVTAVRSLPKPSITAPRTVIGIPMYMGCGLGGGDWAVVRELLIDIEKLAPVDFLVVEFKGNK